MTITRKKWKEKQLYGRLKRLINNISHEKTWAWLRKGNIKRETESLLIAAQNNAIRTNHIKVKIDKAQQNSRCSLCGDRNETINHIINEWSKLAQKGYKTRHDWVVKVIHWELCKKFKFDHMNKCICTTQHLSWRMRHTNSYRTTISARRPDLIIFNNNNKKKKKKKRICKIVDFAVPADHRIKLKESEKKDKYLNLAKVLKKLWNMKETEIPIIIGALDTTTKWLVKGYEDLEIRGRVETFRTTTFLKSARILRRVLETCHSNSRERQSADTDVKYTQGVI